MMCFLLRIVLILPAAFCLPFAIAIATVPVTMAGPFNDMIVAQANQAANSCLSEQDGGPGRSLFDMSAEAFFAFKNSENPIDTTDLNSCLLSAALFHEANQRRLLDGKSRLEHDSRLDEAALMHARSMAQNNYLSHTNPIDPQRRTPLQRVRQTGLEPRMLAENIGNHFSIQYEEGTRIYPVRKDGEQGFATRPGGPLIPEHTYRSFAGAMLDQWMNSPGHRKNILAQAPEFSGAGCAPGQSDSGLKKLYCVQLFFSPANER
jgi:uncharacterized protein YkwD